jgi:hydroxypyruvate isomerase
MTKFSANLGFLWCDRPLPDAIRAAKAAGFDAVECHWPYETSAADVLKALRATGLTMLGLNTRRGDVAAGDNGLAALPSREREARAAIDEALDYAASVRAGNVHVMAGFANGQDAQQTFVANLCYAATQAASKGITILIEPLNSYDVPGYFLSTTSQAAAIISEVGAANLKLMFDCHPVRFGTRPRPTRPWRDRLRLYLPRHCGAGLPRTPRGRIQIYAAYRGDTGLVETSSADLKQIVRN